jgi:hypothetical protein
LIRWATWGKVSHVVLVSPCGRYIVEATHGKGVVLSTLKAFMKRDGAVLRSIPHSDPDACWERAISHAEERYDWKYSWGWVFRRSNWQDPSAWACVELVTDALQLFKDEPAGSITARELVLKSDPL